MPQKNLKDLISLMPEPLSFNSPLHRGTGAVYIFFIIGKYDFLTLTKIKQHQINEELQSD